MLFAGMGFLFVEKDFRLAANPSSRAVLVKKNFNSG
jgi:hypothetical protein